MVMMGSHLDIDFSPIFLILDPKMEASWEGKSGQERAKINKKYIEQIKRADPTRTIRGR